MSLCSNCTSIPFRKAVRRFIQAPRSDEVAYQHYHSQFHEVVQNSKFCGLCSRLAKFSDRDSNPLAKIWLRFHTYPDSTLVSVWTGEEKPEDRCMTSEAYLLTTLAEVGSPLTWITGWCKVHKSPLEPGSFERIEIWKTICEETHVDCAIAKEIKTLPTRLLDVTKADSMDDRSDLRYTQSFLESDIRLVATGGQQGKYMILSYCWGKSQPVVTTRPTLSERQKGIAIGLLPKTIQDAVYLTRQLGMRYLWVDALCIVQDDGDDWAKEAAKMGQYYNNAHLTIVASAASNSSKGCFVERETEDYLSFDVPPSDAEPMRIHLFLTPLPAPPGSTFAYENTFNDPLSQRAWTLQERLLSTRCIIFGPRSTTWECQKTTLSDEGSDDIEGSPREAGRSERDLGYLSLDRWDNVVNAYTHRDLTKSSDKLPALSGLMRTLESRDKDSCVAGVWKRNFHKGLLWWVDNSQTYVKCKASRPDEWRAPSWSFFSIDGHIRYIYQPEGWHPVAEVEEWFLEPLNPANPLGEIKTAFVILKAPILKIPVKPLEQFGDLVALFPLGNRIAKIFMWYDFEQVIPCRIVVITKEAGILVMPTSSSSGSNTEINEYRRIGAASIYYETGVDEKGMQNALIWGLRDEDTPSSSKIKIV